VIDLAFTPVEFQEQPHLYRIDGVEVPSVSQVVEVGAKPWMTPWRMREMRDRLIKTIRPGQKYTRPELNAFYDEAMTASDWATDEAASVGTTVHSWIKSYVRVRQVVGDAAPHLDGLDPESRSSVEAFLEWERVHHVQWLASELIMGSRCHQFAGTTDFLALVDDLLTLGDFKTSKRFSLTYHLQTAGYQLVFEEHDTERRYPIVQRMIVRLPKDGEPFVAGVVSTDAEEDKAEFLRRLASWRWREEHAKQRAGWLSA
jgi:hypothetical protein